MISLVPTLVAVRQFTRVLAIGAADGACVDHRLILIMNAGPLMSQ